MLYKPRDQVIAVQNTFIVTAGLVLYESVHRRVEETSKLLVSELKVKPSSGCFCCYKNPCS